MLVMSCIGDTENEGGNGNGSGGIIKYIVPGALGALSLLLARRWGGVGGGGGAAHVPPTGISRRRRLAACRDPVLKRTPHTHPRPQPTITPLAQTKKLFEDESLNNRRPSRTPRLTTSVITNGDFPKCNFPDTNGGRSANGKDGPKTPEHIPFPNISNDDDDLPFEFMMFLFTTLAAGSQFLNLYRTVWWLPHSYTSQTMNFYLIEPHVVLFIVTIIGRRIPLTVYNSLLKSYNFTKTSALRHVLNIFVLCAIFGILGWCFYKLFPKHPVLSMFFLCYPFSVYLLLFGMNASPFLQLQNPAIFVPHCCANGAPAIRNEVELLKVNFNFRLKQIIFSSLVGAYYASFIPWCFAQQYVHYDVYRIIRHLALVWFGLFTQHATHSFSAQYCDHLHRAALHLGRWVRKGSASSINLTQTNPISSGSSGFPIGGAAPIGPWCHKTVWAPGSLVRHGRWTYTSVGSMTAAEPGNLMHIRFYALFSNPANVMRSLLGMQIILVVLLLISLIYTTEWHFILSLSLLLLSNYYTLYHLVRDSLITWKLYQTEFKIQEKNASSI